MKKIMILFAFMGLGITYASAHSTEMYSTKCDSTKSCSSKKGDAHCKGKKAKAKKKSCCSPKTSLTTKTFPVYASKKEEQYIFSV